MIYIDTDMPDNCIDCFACYDYIYCTITGKKLNPMSMNEYRMLSCPLKDRPKGEWIPITSNNYPTDREVLACDKDGDMIVGELMCGGERCEASGTDDYRDHIVAYMEKPEPYKAESEDI